MLVIGIRVDANEIVATGHMMRCMAIAKEIEKHGETVLFFLADSFGISFLEEAGFSYVVLGSDWEHPIVEIPGFAQELKERRIKEVLFDSYSFTREYFAELKTATNNQISFTYMDDLFEDLYPVDQIVNYNAYHIKFPYREKYGKDVELLLGPSFTPLREEFAKEPSFYKKEEREEEKKVILLSCGGGDTLHAMKAVLQKYQRLLSQTKTEFDWKTVEWQVVVGRLVKDREALFKMARENENIHIQVEVKEMAKLMAYCDLAVSAAGTMLYELCAMQVPTVFFITADNQRYDGEYFSKNEEMFPAGDLRNDREACLENVFEGVESILTNPALYDKMKQKLAEITDGHGAERIALSLLQEKTDRRME